MNLRKNINKLLNDVNIANEQVGTLFVNQIINNDKIKTIKIFENEKESNKELKLDIKVKKRGIGSFTTVMTGDVNDFKRIDIGTTGVDGPAIKPQGVIIKMQQNVKAEIEKIFKDNVLFTR